MLRCLNYNRRYVNYLMLFGGSIIEYGCEIWGFANSKELERIHLKFLEYFLCVKSPTSNIPDIESRVDTPCISQNMCEF